MWRRVRKITEWVLGIVIGLPLVVIVLVFVLLNIGPGQRLVERLANQATAGQVVISGLGGRFPDALRLAHAEVHDTKGAYLILDDITLDWSPLRLLSRQARVDLLRAGRVQVLRLPVAAPTPAQPQPQSNQPFSLPVQVAVEKVQIDRAEIGAPVAGVAAVLALNGSAHLASLQDGDVNVVIDRQDSPGHYAVQGRIDPTHIAAQLDLSEPEGGLISAVAKQPKLGAIALKANVDGPRTDETANLSLTAGPLQAALHGTLNLDGQTADMDVTAKAPAMSPAPGVSWQSVDLDVHVHGPFTKPDATGHLNLAGVEAAGAGFASLAADLQGNQGAAGLHATITGLKIPGPKPDLLAAPLNLTADVRLDQPDRPVTFTLDHPLIQANGTAKTGGAISANVNLTLPDLQPLAAAGGVDIKGRSQLAVQAAMAGNTTKVDVDGTLGVTGGMAPVPALIGDAAKIGVSAQMTGSDITLSRLQVGGKTLTVSASGTDKSNVLDMAYQVALSDLAAVTPTVMGNVALQGTAKGTTTDLAVAADVKGDIGAKGIPRGPVTVSLQASGLPSKPSGAVTASGTLMGAPLNLAVKADRAADGAMSATIDRADWKSLHAEGAVTMAPGATLPQGKVSLHMTRLDDLRVLVGQAVSGSIVLDAALNDGVATANLTATNAGIPGTRVSRAVLAARVTNPTSKPDVAATLDVSGIEANGISGSAKLAANGPQDALGLKLSAALHNLAGADATVNTAVTVNATGKTVQLSTLQAVWKGQTVRLLAPARVSFGDGVAVDRLRVGLQQAVLEVAGRATPTLNLTASLRGVTPALAKPFAPSVDADGQISADAKLTGTPAAPQGTVRLTATGLHMRSGQGRALPPANLNANVQLAGHSADVDVRFVAGQSNLAVTGRAPLGQGELGLRATGGVDLAMLDPILAADGRRARGRIALNASIGGTTASPQANGTVTLAGGEVQDFAQGIHLTNMAATIEATGQTVRIASFTAQAGPGTISAGGTVGLQAPMPIDLTLTMHNARPLASDMLTATLDASLAVRGAVQQGLAASGKIDIQRADINIPDRLPTSVAVLNVRKAGSKPPPPPAPGPAVRLDLTLDTPGEIFVRGHGLDAVLGGTLHVAGTSAAPLVNGGFSMQRGQFSLAGTTLNFTRGQVSFNGAGPSGKIDPSLDFEATTTTSTSTATLDVGGYASAPKITLSSSPPLPQDEVLAELLFGQSASSLSPFQYAEIAAALAQLSGAGGGGDPLNSVRKGLGLDRLSVGGGANGSSSTSIEAGRYVANGVYVGAKQGTGNGAQTQAQVQIDLYKGLKAETDVGAGSGGNSVGLSYQFEY